MRQTLYRLRKLIPEVQSKHGDEPVLSGAEVAVPFLLSNRQTIQINPDADYFLDVAIFDKGNPAQAIPLYRGDFLADFFLPDSEPFEEWAAGRRAAGRRRVLELLAGETAVHIQNANYDQAINLARQQLTIDNLRESGHCQLMEALARNGRRQEALAHYNHLCQLLQTELAIEPSQEIRALIETIRADAFDRPVTPVRQPRAGGSRGAGASR
jgi:DNA-binding SARP family transcriptional activator